MFYAGFVLFRPGHYSGFFAQRSGCDAEVSVFGDGFCPGASVFGYRQFDDVLDEYLMLVQNFGEKKHDA